MLKGTTTHVAIAGTTATCLDALGLYLPYDLQGETIRPRMSNLGFFIYRGMLIIPI